MAGNETRTAKLSVVELPFAPSNVKAERLTGSNQRVINLTWTPGFDGNSPILKYIVQRREVSEIGKRKSICTIKTYLKKQIDQKVLC